ncbi:MAG TPA: glutaminyl-peptide cyclotransferase [Flavitalea sp.]|nr:glutaminyl-peptide cyclotransferase [Flavitalea sp.]
MMRKTLNVIVFFSFLFAGCNNEPEEDTTEDAQVTTGPTVLPFSLIGTQPHDISYFTEGFEYHNGQLYESSGSDSDPSGSGPGPYPSAFGIVDSATGKVTPKVTLDKSKYFGEGITIFKGKIYHLTYKEKVGFVYDLKTYKKLKEFPLPAPEGWGLTHDTSRIIMSVGTNQLYYLHPDSLTTTNILSVYDNNGPLTSRLNELEFINGYIYANEWYTNYIAKIDPSTGKVVGRLDLSLQVKEAKQRNPNANEMNGIAYDSVSNNILVTGKNWPVIYKIRLQ